MTFRHFDPWTQALAKLQRGHDRDMLDARAMLGAGLVTPHDLLRTFNEITPQPTFARGLIVRHAARVGMERLEAD